ncbi:tyrosine-protein phosphatase 3 [Monosporozyma servazzii]
MASNFYSNIQPSYNNNKNIYTNPRINTNNMKHESINNNNNINTPVKGSFFDYHHNEDKIPSQPFVPTKTASPNTMNVSPNLQSPTTQTNQYSHLLKSMYTPSFTPLKPKENQFIKPKGCSLISSMELGKILSTKNEKNLLILDTRPFADRSKSYIKNSLHICLPSTLLRRKNFSLEKLIESLPIFEQKIVLDKFNEPNLEIILYDNIANQTDSNISLALSGIAVKILNYYKFIDCNRNIVLILESGFPQFEKLFPEFITNYSTLSEMHLLKNENINNPSSYNVPPFTDSFQPNNNPSNIDYYNSLTPPLPSSTNSSEKNTLNDSPISSSSPISALFKFQLPTTKSMPSQLFKFSQNEEIMNLESYLSAVNINEENQRLQLNNQDNDIINSSNLYNFEFPKRSNLTSSQPLQDKLNVQLKYDNLLKHYSQDEIDNYIPKWFQKLMTRPKIQFIARYQRLDILEKKRLNVSISKNLPIPTRRTTTTTFNSNETHKQSGSETNVSSTTYARPKLIQTRSMSQPNIYGTTTRKHSWLKDIDSDDEDDENDQIIISSGVELGGKNRYKDIFPYEHTRVHLKKSSIDSNSLINSTTISEEKERGISDSNDSIEEEEDISDNYINANYLHVPDLDLTETPPTSIRNNISSKVRYIATQAPMLSTVHDFYTCILNDNIPIVLSLTKSVENGIEKCFKYWKEKDYNNIKVKLLEETNISDSIVIRRIKLIYDNDTKSYELLQLQLTSWPDLGVVKSPRDIIQLINLKNIILSKLSKSPHWSYMSTPTIMVHCSAGCGRTGAWCTIDSILSNLSTFNFLQSYYTSETSTYDPISWIVNIFRKQRISMVQNINQFLFIYDCLLYYFSLTMSNDNQLKNDAFNHTTNISNTANTDSLLQGLIEELQDLPIINNFIHSKIASK